MSNCEHSFVDVYCDRCGKYAGMACEYCGEGYDGGDHMVSQTDIWCECTVEELEEYRIAEMHMPEE